ncbi:MAG: type II methionyl aminopeptidase [Euryarchaeota archaeon]|nr:type II methionyl aminopeptidase [Euryarchaeota archaeon]
MDEESRKLYLEAGKIAARIMAEGFEEIQEGQSLKELADSIEERMRKAGARPAFPVNISINDVAAHYSPDAWDETVFEKGQLVKLDLGVHLEGHIADIARSRWVGGGDERLIEASEKALEKAIEIIRPGVTTDQIGAVIEETITSYGYRPVENLTGHMLKPYNLHGGVLIPNIKTRHGEMLKEGDVFAMEPFATDGAGRVMDDNRAIIFKYLQDRPLRMKEARLILAHVKENYATLPFAERWIAPLVPRFKLNQALRQLAFNKAIYAYHILRERTRGTVSQAEHTIMVTEDGCIVTTRE